METLRNVNQVSLNFNLREPKKLNGSTNVYAVVKMNGKQTKISINCKVNAWCWDAKKQVPKVSQNMTQNDIANNMQVNNVLNDVRMKFYAYLCSVEQIDENQIKDLLTNSNNNEMANKNAIPPKRTKTASKLLNEAFERHYGNKKETESYRTAKAMTKDFFDFLKQKNIYDSVATLSKKGMAQYKDYLIEKARAKGSGTNVTIEKKVNYIIMLINELSERHDNITPLKRHKIIKTVAQEDKKVRALTNEEVNAFMKCDLKDNKELELYRDMFQMQLESGVRVSDLQKLFNGEYTKDFQDGKEMLTLRTKKKGITAIVIINPIIKALQKKYINGLPFELNKRKREDYNKGLKKIAELANFTQQETFVTEHLGEKRQETKRLCDIIASHFARHSFITNMVKGGFSVDYLCYLSGHSDDTMIRQIYTHLTQSDKNRIVAKEIQRIENTQQANESNANELIQRGKQEKENDIIKECKDVLMFLGADYKDICDINNIDYLMYLVYDKYYKPFEKMGIETLQLKEIYNTNPTFQEKQKALNEVIEKAKERLQMLAEN
jgi:site-specific recombinase XerD